MHRPPTDPPEPGRSRRVLVVSDTHLSAATLERMPADVWGLASAADLIIHAGDVVELAVLDALRERAPVHAVLGNNDRGLGGQLPETLEIDIDGIRVAAIHDSGPTAGRHRRMARRFPGAEVVIFGHSHHPLVERTDQGQLLVNPGSPTQRRRQPVHTVGWLEVDTRGHASAVIVEVGPRAGSRHSAVGASP